MELPILRDEARFEPPMALREVKSMPGGWHVVAFASPGESSHHDGDDRERPATETIADSSHYSRQTVGETPGGHSAAYSQRR